MYKYIYVFVRQDLSLPQQLVQVGHACQESGAAYGCPEECRLVLIGVADEDALLLINSYLKMENIENVMFYEPDYDMGYTCVCTRPVEGDERKLFARFETYKT